MTKKYNFLKTAAVLVSTMVVATIFAGCQAPVDINKSGGGSDTTQDFPVVVNEVTINEKPDKVAVLSGSVADVIIAMGYETSLVIASDDCVQPELQTLAKSAPGDMQAVIDAGVDLAISDTFTEEQIATLQGAKILTISIQKSASREDFERQYTQVGSVFGGAGTGYSAGLSSAQKIFTSLDDLSRIIPVSNKVITGAMVFDANGAGITGDMLGSTLMTYAGITNVLKGTTGGVYDFEQLRIQNPELIFCPEGIKAQLTANADFAKLNAVKNDRVYEIPSTYMVWEGRTVITAATYLAGIAYPQLREAAETSATMPEGLTSSAATSSASGESSASSTASSEATTESSTASEASATEAPPAEASAETYEAIAPGSDGATVLAMQDRLYELGFLSVDYSGMYGSDTEEAIMAFQATNGLPETGEADSATLTALYSGGAKAVE